MLKLTAIISIYLYQLYKDDFSIYVLISSVFYKLQVYKKTLKESEKWQLLFVCILCVSKLFESLAEIKIEMEKSSLLY